MTLTRHTRPAPAVLFDIDGTLVDSNYLHVHAWSRAFAEIGRPVEAWRIHRSIGMDGSTLVATLAEDADDDAARGSRSCTRATTRRPRLAARTLRAGPAI